MATRFYLASTGSAPVSPAYHSYWSKTGQAVRRPCGTTGGGTALTDFTTTETFATQETILVAQFVSDQMPAQTISAGTELRTVLSAHEGATAAGAYLLVLVRVMNSAGTVERDILWTGIGMSLTTAAKTYTQLGTYGSNLSVSNNDRVVIEFGWDAQNTVTSSQSATLRFGDTGTDYAYTSGLTSVIRRPWLEVGGDLFAVPAYAGTAGLSGSGALTVSRRVGLAGTAALSGTGTLSSNALAGTAGLAGVGTLSAVGAKGASEEEPPRDPDHAPHDPDPPPPVYSTGGGTMVRRSVVMAAPTLVDGRPT